MINNDREPGVHSQAAAVQNSSDDAANSVSAFTRKINELFPLELLQSSFRATPYGIFVAEDAIEKATDSYRSWLASISDGKIVKSQVKCFKRLFGGEQPQRRYLIEGKFCLTGYLIELPIAEPQRLNLPYFLGSLSDMTSYIHPRDPLLASLAGVETQPAGDGFDFIIAHGAERYRITTPVLKEFVSFAANSARLMRAQPELSDSLAGALKVLIRLLRQSRPIKEKFEFVIPWQYRDLQRFRLRNFASLTFVFDRGNCLVHCFDLAGKNLVRFIKREFDVMQPKRLGCFEIFGPRERALGCFHLAHERLYLSTRAFIDFFNQLRHSPDNRERFAGVFTVRECFSRFSDIFQRSAPIGRDKLGHYTEHAGRQVKQFRINGNWIFFIGGDAMLIGCVAKHCGSSRNNSRRRHSRERPRNTRR